MEVHANKTFEFTSIKCIAQPISNVVLFEGIAPTNNHGLEAIFWILSGHLWCWTVDPVMEGARILNSAFRYHPARCVKASFVLSNIGRYTATKVSNSFIVAETVIVGTVPDTYTYFSTDPDTYEEDLKDYILNNS